MATGPPVDTDVFEAEMPTAPPPPVFHVPPGESSWAPSSPSSPTVRRPSPYRTEAQRRHGSWAGSNDARFPFAPETEFAPADEDLYPSPALPQAPKPSTAAGKGVGGAGGGKRRGDLEKGLANGAGMGNERDKGRADEGGSEVQGRGGGGAGRGGGQGFDSPQPLLTGSTSGWQKHGGNQDKEKRDRKGKRGAGAGEGPRAPTYGVDPRGGQGNPRSGRSNLGGSTPSQLPKRRRCCTWLVPSMVIGCCVMFVVTMYRNNCPNENGRKTNDCVLPFLGRFSFEPVKVNPMIGPSANTLLNIGALESSRVRGNLKQKYRLFSYVWLHAGIVHLVVNMLGLIFLGVRLEKVFGWFLTMVVYLLSAFGGSLFSALLLAPNTIVVGASGAVLGLLGATLAELIINWSIYENRLTTLFMLVFLSALNLAIGLTPQVDNFSHIGGFVSGLLLGFVFFIKPQYGYYTHSVLPVEYFYANANGGGPYPSDGVKPRKYNKFQITIRCLALAATLFGFGAAMAFVYYNVDGNKECGWCKYMDCVKTSYWKCQQPVCTYNGDTRRAFCPNGKVVHTGPNPSLNTLERICRDECS